MIAGYVVAFGAVCGIIGIVVGALAGYVIGRSHH